MVRLVAYTKTIPLGLIPIVVCFPAGIKTYLEDPAAILALPLPDCPRCRANAGRWDVHGWYPRYTSFEGRPVLTRVCRLRCPLCRLTPRLLPEEIPPWVQHALPDIKASCEIYVENDISYREAAMAVASASVPPQESLSTCWGNPDAPSLAPSTIFRWVDRFSRGAGEWWIILAAEAQARSAKALRPQEAPQGQAAKARSAAKAGALKTAWHLLALLRWLLDRLRIPDWPRLLMRSPTKPRALDHTGFFATAAAPRAPAPP